MNFDSNTIFFDEAGKQVDSAKGKFWKWKDFFGILSPEVPLKCPDWMFKKGKKIVFQDFYIPFLDWNKIRQADLLIAGWNHPEVLGHISLRNDDLPLNSSIKKPFAVDMEAYQQLTEQVNSEFFLQLAARLDQHGQDYLRALLPESTSEYTLEGLLRTFHQEMTSPLLKKRIETIKAAKQSLFAADSFLQEKELVKERQALKENLNSLLEIASQVRIDGFPMFQNLVKGSSFEQKEGALFHFAKLFSLQIVFIGNPAQDIDLNSFESSF